MNRHEFRQLMRDMLPVWVAIVVLASIAATTIIAVAVQH